MSKHRGFKSNRKANRTNEDDAGKIADAAKALREKLADTGAPTYGAWLAERHGNGDPVRIRPAGEGAKISYDFYPTRAMLEAEFDHIWRMQARHHPNLTKEAREKIRDTLFFQRPLKPVKPGRCTFFPDDERLPKWHPLAQEFLILQQLNMMRFLDERGELPLDQEKRDLLMNHLMAGEKLTWAGLRRTLKIPAGTEINLEKGGLKEIAHNATAARLAVGTKKNPAPLADSWHKIDPRRRLLLLKILAVTANPERTRGRLENWVGLAPDAAANVEKVTLPPGHLMLGLRATRAIVQAMREEVIVYSAAIERASERGLFGDGVALHHSDLRSEGDPGLLRLPRYYELTALQRMLGTGTGNPDDPPEIRFGKIANPTVHIALGQFRRVMNALIDRYGKPDQVVIETTRDMAKSARELNEIDAEIRKNTKRNDAWREELEEGGILAPRARAGDRFMRMRLWEELGKTPADRLCPYSGKPISLTQLHSDEVEIDHILPFEDTFDDSPANKTVCFRAANRIKRKRAPGDAWSGEELNAIIERVKGAPGMARKLWRFLPGALHKWQEQRGFEDRQLHATGYLAKVVRAYAEALFPKDGTSNIWMPTGRMTAMLRRRWFRNLPGHNAKTRDDHRHHALDAAVVGVIDRRTIQMLQTQARRHGTEELDRLLPDPPEPFPEYRDQVLARVAKLNVSHRPDRPITKREAMARRERGEKHIPSTVNGRLHEDNAYGIVQDNPENQAARTIGNLVKRKPVIDLSKDEIGQVRDERLRQELLNATEGKRDDKKAREAALREWSDRTGHQRIRLLVMDNTAMPVDGRMGHPRENEPYKWLIPGENAFVDILESPDGRWFHHGTRVWEAASCKDRQWKEVYPEARLIMRLYKYDTLQLFQWDPKEKAVIPGTNTIKVVRSIPDSPTNKNVRLVGANLAIPFSDRDKQRDGEQGWEAVAYDVLRKRRARRVRVDELGRVRIVPHGVI
ncbi:CRISPR-associated Csn1 family endonuclease [Rhodovulum adriaticum]|uniref:CRISPR-associated Csn1 family endonuclease n=2 Tax=Rhodovulum adriaticum TaxID=35804 RepID=A0A4R2NLV1_RHOAD|nr:CRISPR-associated Csn1 family endonuclease [Rhodovulum adriaticum]